MADLLGIDQSVHRLEPRNARAREDRENDRNARPALRFRAPEREGRAERDRGRSVAEVVDQVGEERNARCCDEDQKLGCRSDPKDEQGQRHGTDALSRALDRRIDETVGMPVALLGVGVGPGVRMGMGETAGMAMKVAPESLIRDGVHHSEATQAER
jgi:hypothetical protein